MGSRAACVSNAWAMASSRAPGSFVPRRRSRGPGRSTGRGSSCLTRAPDPMGSPTGGPARSRWFRTRQNANGEPSKQWRHTTLRSKGCGSQACRGRCPRNAGRPADSPPAESSPISGGEGTIHRLSDLPHGLTVYSPLPSSERSPGGPRPNRRSRSWGRSGWKCRKGRKPISNSTIGRSPTPSESASADPEHVIGLMVTARR